MSQLSNLQREVEEKMESSVTQGKVYQEMEARHQKQLEEIREAGHQTLAIMVEEYKVRMMMTNLRLKMQEGGRGYQRVGWG